MLRNRLPASRPVAVTQKFVVVTCNYPARERGVGKLMVTAEAVRRCPELKLVSGEDLTPYREASDAVLEVLSRFGPTQRAGLDEFYLDATAAARAGVDMGAGARWAPGTNVHTAAMATTTAEALAGTGTCYRPMDLRAAPQDGGAAPGAESDAAACAAGSAAGGAAVGGVAAAGGGAAGGGAAGGARVGIPAMDFAPALLLAASAIASSARAAVVAATGLTSSVGIGHNKLVAKLAASLHKPDAQTALPPGQVHAFLAPLPLRVLPGIGARAAGALAAIGLTTIGEARAALARAKPAASVREGVLEGLVPVAKAASRTSIVQALGTAGAARLAAQCEGRCSDPVQQQKPPQSLTVEDSFRGCTDHAALVLVARVLAPDIERRMSAERSARGRRATSLVVRWRHHGTRTINNPIGWAAEAPMGALVASRSVPMPEGGASAIARAAEAVLRAHLKPPFRITSLALTATKFGRAQGPAAPLRWTEAGWQGTGPNLVLQGTSTSLVGADRAPAGALPSSPMARAAAQAARHCAFRADYAVGGQPWVGEGRRNLAVLAKGAGGGVGVAGSELRLMSKQEERALREAAGLEGDEPGCSEELTRGGGLFHGWEGEEDFVDRGEEALTGTARHSRCLGGQSSDVLGLWATTTSARSGGAPLADSLGGGALLLAGGGDASETERSSIADRPTVPEHAALAGTAAAAPAVVVGAARAGLVEQWTCHGEEGEEGWAVEELAAYLRPSAPSVGPTLVEPSESVLADSAPLRCDQSPPLRPGSPDLPPWSCAACTFVNAGPMRVCEMCEAARMGEVAAAGGAAGCSHGALSENNGALRGASAAAGVGGGAARASRKRAALSPARGGATGPRAKRSAGHGTAAAAPAGRSRGAVSGGARPAARANGGGAARQATLQRFLGLKGAS